MTKKNKIEKAIQLVELKKDRETLIGQANAISGVINYISQKIATLEKPEVVEEGKQ